MAVDLQSLAECVIQGKKDSAVALVREGLEQGMDPNTLINEGLIAGMAVVGQRFKCNEYYIPEVLISARAMKECMALLRPLLADTGPSRRGPSSSGPFRATSTTSARTWSR